MTICPCCTTSHRLAETALTAGTVFAWYALPDVVRSAGLRGVLKTTAIATPLALTVAWHCPWIREKVADLGCCAGEGGCGRGSRAGEGGCGCGCEDRPVSAAGATDFAADDAIGVEPSGRDVLGTLRDKQTFESGGTCGCGGGGKGGCCRDKEAAAGEAQRGSDKPADTADGCPAGVPQSYSELTDRLPDDPKRRYAILGGAALALVGVSVASERAIFRFGEWRRARGARAPHTQQAALFAALTGAATYAVASLRDNNR